MEEGGDNHSHIPPNTNFSPNFPTHILALGYRKNGSIRRRFDRKLRRSFEFEPEIARIEKAFSSDAVYCVERERGRTVFNESSSGESE